MSQDQGNLHVHLDDPGHLVDPEADEEDEGGHGEADQDGRGCPSDGRGDFLEVGLHGWDWPRGRGRWRRDDALLSVSALDPAQLTDAVCLRVIASADICAGCEFHAVVANAGAASRYRMQKKSRVLT